MRISGTSTRRATTTTAVIMPWTSRTPRSPRYKWRIRPIRRQAPYLGDPWSKMMVHRVKIGGNEKWVGFIGGGHNLSSCTGTGCDRKRERVLRRRSHRPGTCCGASPGPTTCAWTTPYPEPRRLSIRTTTASSDLAYIGDLGGNIWRLRFCSQADGILLRDRLAGRGSLLYSAGWRKRASLRSAPAVTKDANGNVWVYWGDGQQGGTDRHGRRDGPVLCREGHRPCPGRWR